MSSDICKCGLPDLCPTKEAVVELAEMSTIQMNVAREKFSNLLCSPKYTFAWSGQILSYTEKQNTTWIKFQLEQVFKGGNILII